MHWWLRWTKTGVPPTTRVVQRDTGEIYQFQTWVARKLSWTYPMVECRGALRNGDL